MGIEQEELRVERMLTDAFISADSLQVVLNRTTEVSDGAGGVLLSDTAPLAAQKMRLLPLGDGAVERLTADGRVVRPSYMLLGNYDANMQRGDTFTLSTGRYQVVFVNENRQYEVKGEVAYVGQ